MADTNEVISKRDKHLERMRKKYPDRSFEDDEDVFGAISDDYDDYEQRLGDMETDRKKLSDMFAADPRSADIIARMADGEDPVVGLVRNYGEEIRDILDDPEMADKIAEANKEYIERLAKSKELDREYDENLSQSIETLRQFQEERGMTDEDADKVMEFLIGIIQEGVMGKFSAETLDMALKALNHDDDVAFASEEGEVAGRNAKIVEQLRKKDRGDGTRPLNGKNGSAGRQSEQSIFDLANEAM